MHCDGGGGWWGIPSLATLLSIGLGLERWGGGFPVNLMIRAPTPHVLFIGLRDRAH